MVLVVASVVVVLSVEVVAIKGVVELVTIVDVADVEVTTSLEGDCDNGLEGLDDGCDVGLALGIAVTNGVPAADTTNVTDSFSTKFPPPAATKSSSPLESF